MATQLMFLESSSVAFTCVATLKSTLQGETESPRLGMWTVVEVGCASVCCLCSAVGVVGYQELSL